MKKTSLIIILLILILFIFVFMINSDKKECKNYWKKYSNVTSGQGQYYVVENNICYELFASINSIYKGSSVSMEIIKLKGEK